MNWLNKILGHKGEQTDPSSHPTSNPKAGASATAWRAGIEHIRFGRYSDNNKSVSQTKSWYIAEDRFKEKNYTEAISAFFHYLSDEAEGNVSFSPDGKTFRFTLVQGSKKIYGESDGQDIIARSPLAIMETPSTAVMRRLLEMNYSLYYSHSAIDDGSTLYMVFQTDIPSASPSKLYYGLRELATKSDRQDDLLLSDFPSLKPVDVEHIQPLPQAELDIKYRYFRKWIEDALNRAAELNADSFAGAIAYILLTLIYRIDFLILPEAALLARLDKINSYYWERKDEVPLVERNKLMIDGIRKLLEISREEFARSVYRSKGTFSITTPPKSDKAKDHIISANKDSHWYVENKYPDLSLIINEYGLVYNQFIYSMPKVQTDLITIYMSIMHQSYFQELGLKTAFYDKATGELNEELIKGAIDAAVEPFKDKYREMKWDHNRVSYETLYDFGVSFSEHLANMNLETKRD